MQRITFNSSLIIAIIGILIAIIIIISFIIIIVTNIVIATEVVMTKEGVQRITPFLTSDLVVHSVINSRNMNHDPVDDDYGEGDDGESE